VGELPQHRLELPPHVGGMIPRSPHMQCELGQRIEPLDFGRQKFVYRIRGAARFAHVMSVVPFVL